MPVNYGTGETYGFETILALFPAKFWSMNASYSLFEQNYSGSNVISGSPANALSWYGKLTNNFSVWRGAKLQFNSSYNAPVATPQGTRIATYFTDLGFQQKLLKGNARLGIIITDIFNTLNTGYDVYADGFEYHRRFKVDTRAILLTFAYTFGSSFKEELMENKFSND
jgi:hypothetical protein